MVSIKHRKTNTVPDWTQSDLDTVIAGGAAPLPPSGTLISEITVPSDWNDEHELTGTIPATNLEAAGTNGQMQFNASGSFGAVGTSFYNSTDEYLGINNTNPQAVIHVKEGTLPARPPNPTGTATLSETNIDSGYWTNIGNSFTVQIFTYKIVGGDIVYSASSISASYDDDYNGDHTYDLSLDLSAALPAGADGFRAFIYWYDGNLGEDVWTFNRYVQFADQNEVIDNSALSGSHSSSRVSKTIHENLERYYKNSTVRFMDSSNTTHAMWDASTNRFAVGTTTPTDFVHFKGTTTTLPSNPTGTATATEVTGYDDPYYNDGNTNSYRVHTYKLVNGKLIISSGYLSCSYTDNGNADMYYSVEITMSAAAPAGTDGYCVFRVSGGVINPASYLLTAATAIDGGVFTTSPITQTSTLVNDFIIDTARLKFLNSSGVQTLFIDGETGSFENLNIIQLNPSTIPLNIKLTAGAAVRAISVRNSADVEIFNVSSFGFITSASGLGATTGNFTSSLTTDGNFSSRTATFRPSSSSSDGVAITALVGQTGPLLRFNNSGGGQQLAIAANGLDFILDTTTGTKIGTTTSQKLGFWGATPIVRPTTSVAAATFVQNTGSTVHQTSTFDGYTIEKVVKALRNIGILA